MREEEDTAKEEKEERATVEYIKQDYNEDKSFFFIAHTHRLNKELGFFHVASII